LLEKVNANIEPYVVTRVGNDIKLTANEPELQMSCNGTVFRNRRVLNESKRWRFLAARPFSAGLFFGAITTIWFYYFGGASAIWRLAIDAVAGLSFARLAGGLVEASWKRQFLYGLMFVFIITELLNVLGFPLPLFRLYTVLAALAGLL
jgi:hypothetical protein